ncbi:MAG: site-specific recombinase, partial [Thermomicrobiales bacterium]|nr:site-specific recombinase [Thermomicrobiales bacterium]
LDAQDRAAHLFAAAHGWTIVATYPEEGKSAWTDDVSMRPRFAEMLADAEAGLFDVLIVHKLDRFARNLRVTLETLQRLDRARVSFVSISENMDFSTPIGKVILATLAAFAQYYSENLSAETRKGKAERKAQGLYNGLLPFGIKKNSVGIPVPDPETYPGLLLAFQLGAQGKSDREVGEALNAAGYRTTGNRGKNPFTKDTVRVMLRNRFYLGELPDGAGGWLDGAHEAVLDDELFDAAMKAREINQNSNTTRVNRRHRRYSLSGLAVCGTCGGRLHFHTERDGRARVYCYQERQGVHCGQRSARLDGIEEQIAAYLATFQLPDDLVTTIISLYDQASAERDDTARRRTELTGRLARIKELYTWGDMDRAEYRAERDRLESELAATQSTTDRAALMAHAAALLRSFPAAWATAPQEQRNDLAKMVFRSVEIKDDRVLAVVPQPEFAPFFVIGGNETGRSDGTDPACQDSTLAGGSDGIRTRGLSLDRAAC